jgi:tetratricopeptide (TPR) repeat protein
VWAQTYDRDLADVFAIQSEIAHAIADQLRARISPEEHVRLAQAPTKDVLAFQLYQQARELKGHNSDPSAGARLFQAAELVEQATKRDPQFLQAWCLLAEVQLDLYWEGLDHTEARREASRVAVEQAVRLQPNAGETHLTQGIYYYHGLSDYARALDELALARRSLPNNSDVSFYSAAIFRRQGYWADALRAFKLAAELDPRNFSVLSETAHTAEAMGHYAEATRSYDEALAVNPGDIYTRERLAFIPYLERADPRPLHALNAEILASEPGAVEASAYFRLCGALAERDPVAARMALVGFPPRGYQIGDFYVPPEWFAGLTARTFGDEAGARTAFLAAREKVEQVVREHPDYATAWSVLGWIDAGLGHKEEAIREGQHGCELMPSSKDAYSSPNLVGFLAMIYAWTGETDLALQTLREVIHVPVGLSSNTRYGSLKLDPHWDPLRGDPRFEQLVADLAPKNSK